MTADEILAALPVAIRNELISCYETICRSYTENRWEPAELNGGKLAEVAYTVVKGALDGVFPATASKPNNMLSACRALEQYPADSTRIGDRSLRILIPRLLPVLYEIRNNRGVGHVGGDVDPNHEDAEAVLAMASWVMAEFVRIFHGISLTEAQEAVEQIVSRRHPLIWSFGDMKRVLDASIPRGNQVLLLLYSEAGWVSTEVLQQWVEYSNRSIFRNKLLQKLHGDRLIEHDAGNGRARISPKGISVVEDSLL